MESVNVSIILPVYNVEPYIKQCIDSIINQTYKEWELIIVDDGSPDNCGIIADEYAAQDSRILVVHQKNQGVSVARNTGLDKARGKYIAFVDSDDYLECNYLQAFMNEACEDTIVCCGHNRIFDDGSVDKRSFDVVMRLSLNEYLYLLLQEEIKGMKNGKNRLGNFMCFKIFPALCFKNIRFPEGKSYEDMYIDIELFKKVTRFVILPEVTYNYRIRIDSTMRMVSSKNDSDYLCARIKQESDLQDTKDFLNLAEQLTLLQCSRIYSAYLNKKYCLTDEERQYIRKIIKERI